VRGDRAVSRREFLKRSGQAGLGAMALGAGGGLLLPARGEGASGTREIFLEAREVRSRASRSGWP